MAHSQRILFPILVAFLLATPLSHAADNDMPPPNGKPPGPPPEAIAACTGKTAGTQVSFTGRRGETMTGTCELVGSVLAARPAGGPPSGAGGPPPAR